MRVRKFSIHRSLFIIFLLFLLVAPAWAQEPMTAEVDSSTLSTDDTLTLTVTITGGNATPQLPPLDDFQIVGTSTATQISIINGAMSSQAAYRYTLRPLHTGDLVIGAVSATIDGQSYTTQPITVYVTAGTAPTAGSSAAPPVVVPPGDLTGQDFFVEAEVDNDQPYLGEQVVYTFRFYQGEQLFAQPIYERPEFTGFWSQETAQQDQQMVQLTGDGGNTRTYRVATLQTILFPTVPGEQTIDPARLQIPGSFGQAGLTLPTDMISVTVRPLPQPAPSDFSGAVGQFDLQATIDKDTAAVNDSITLHLTLQGVGSLETITDPVWPVLDGWRSFTDAVTTNTHTESSTTDNSPVFAGSKEYDWILIPGQAGQFAIPSITYTYFNPATAAYETTSTEPIPVSVTGSGEGEVSVSPTLTSADPVLDIRHIKPVPTTLSSTSSSLLSLPLYWAVWVFPLLLFIGAAWWRHGHETADPAVVRRTRAQKRALHMLQQARKDNADPYAMAAQVIAAYLTDKLDQPIAGLTRSALTALLTQHGLPTETCDQVLHLLDQSDWGRFSPLGMDGDLDLWAQTEQLINELEGKWVTY